MTGNGIRKGYEKRSNIVLSGTPRSNDDEDTLLDKDLAAGMHSFMEWMERLETRSLKLESLLLKIEERLTAIEKVREPPEANEKNYSVKEFAEKVGLSAYTVQRAISHGMIKVIYLGKRPIVMNDEAQRIFREGLGRIPQGYKAIGDRMQPRPKATSEKKGARKRR